ncbi:hypothetical protein CK203_080705 [Vitis vinifera]|uniref:R13L1/DRL21-like LRR repeat region domain-containing protein n=1 Tax=Vitis vinifera TaxID=29760 RepID=A0A438DZF4_VITVI|nr:hypothetical protein CK203_080705 [Vitis vinifera]
MWCVMSRRDPRLEISPAHYKIFGQKSWTWPREGDSSSSYFRLAKVEPYENDVGFISIIGMGGVGKNARAVCFGEICFCLEDNLESNHQSTISKETRHSSFILGKFDVFKKFEAFQEFEHLRTFVALPIHGVEGFVTSAGKICISKLENVVDVQDARDANLKTKLNVERLSMIWSQELDGSHDEDTEMEVLLSLQPHTNLKELGLNIMVMHITTFRWATTLPQEDMRNGKTGVGQQSHFLASGSSISGLSRLQPEFMQSLLRLELPEIDNSEEEEQGLPYNLQRLEIWTCDKLERLPHGLRSYTSLAELIIEDCPNWCHFQRWVSRSCLESLPEGIVHHHSNNTTNCGLQILDIFQGSSLASFSTGKFPSTRKSITMDNCAQLQPISEEMFHCNNNALEELFISRLPNLKIIPDCFYNLKIFGLKNITNCQNIKVPLSEWGLARLTSLRTLTIGGIFQEATSFSNHHHHLFLLPTTLVELCISSFQNLESLAFLSLQTLTSLRKLYVFQCPKLQSFIPRDRLADMLSEVYTRDCPLLIQRCSKEKGEDWLKFAHIPCVKIDGKLILEE